MEYELELIEREDTCGRYTLSTTYYKVINYDGDEEKLKEYVKKLNDEAPFWLEYHIHNVKDGIIMCYHDTLD